MEDLSLLWFSLVYSLAVELICFEPDLLGSCCPCEGLTLQSLIEVSIFLLVALCQETCLT